jgi:NADH dehydrogenase
MRGDGQRPQVVIVGGGFGGMDTARALAHERVDITLIDRRNHYLFQPLLYQVATAALNPADIAQPIRSILRKQSNVTVLMDEVSAVEAAHNRLLLCESGTLAYDYLVLATGATHSYFGHDDWTERAPGLKTIEDALEIRRRILYAFEEAERAQERDQQPWLTFVVVGGGPTGVELAGAITEVAFHSLKRDFRRIDPGKARVILLEASPHILGSYSPESQRRAVLQLEQLGVDVRVNSLVTGIDAAGVTIAGGERLAARTVLWGAGVAASPLGRTLGVPLDRAGRFLVTPNLNPPGIANVFIVGDLAAVKQDNGMLVPGVAPAAMQMGKYAAQAIVDLTHDKPIFAHPFHYADKGALATIGRKKAVADFPGHIRMWGFLAWMAWLFIHILFLIGFRNRFIVLFEWAWAYVTFQRGARLITGASPGTYKPVAPVADAGRPAARPVEKSPTPPPAA